MRTEKLAAALACVAMLGACTTVTRGTKQTYAITTTPEEARVQLSTGIACTTPCSLQLKRKKSFTATITKTGYKTETVEVTSKVAGAGVATATVGNFLLGGPIGAVVDASTGAMKTLYPTEITLTLSPEAMPADAAAAAVTAAAADPATAVTPPPATAAPASTPQLR